MFFSSLRCHTISFSLEPSQQKLLSYWWMACQGNTLLTSEAGWPQRPCLDGKCPMTAQWIRDFTLRLIGQRHVTDSGEDGDGLGPTSFRSQILIVPNRIARELRSRIVRRNKEVGIIVHFLSHLVSEPNKFLLAGVVSTNQCSLEASSDQLCLQEGICQREAIESWGVEFSGAVWCIFNSDMI